ncbi:MAG: cellulase family glycosylhydrolase [Verrucomicrobiota bacterium]
MKPHRPLLALLLAGALSAHAALVDNAAMDIDANQDNWPDAWPAVPGNAGTWETEGSNRFIRLTSPRPGALVTLARDIPLPAGTSAVELSWNQRITNLAPGAQSGDARVVLEFFDANRAKLPSDAPIAYYREDSAGWEPKTGTVTVPRGAALLRVTPALVRVDSGSLDFDDLVVKPAAAPEPAPVVAATPPVARSGQKFPRVEVPAKGSMPDEPEQKQYWPPMLKVSGNRLVDPSGREVWLQGVNVPSLEWSVKGESVDRSIVTAIQDWNANVIRLPVKGAHWFGKGTKHNTQKDGGAAYRATVDKAIMLAANRGAYVVLDLHHYRAPRPEDVDFWKDAAARYKDHPAVLFDLLNEPHGIPWETWQKGGFVEEKKKAGDEDAFLSEAEKRENKRGFDSPGMQGLLDAARSTGAKNVVVVGGLDYAYSLTGVLEGHALTDHAGNGIMYATHIYPWKKGWQKRFLDVAAKYPILVGEVGGDAKKMTWLPANHQENVDTWAPAMIGVIQKHRLNWTAWCFHPKASPRMLLDWDYTPTPFWGQLAKDAFNGKEFPYPAKLR